MPATAGRCRSSCGTIFGGWPAASPQRQTLTPRSCWDRWSWELCILLLTHGYVPCSLHLRHVEQAWHITVGHQLKSMAVFAGVAGSAGRCVPGVPAVLGTGV